MAAHLMPILLEATWYLVETEALREVLGAEPWLPIPRARAELPGVVVWRGRAVPLIDVARVLGVTAGGAPQRARTLIVNHEHGMAALPVDAAREVKSVPEARLVPTQGEVVPYATRELDEEGTVMPVIDLDRLLTDLYRVTGSSLDSNEI